MKRRLLLALGGTALATGLTGCVGEGGGDGGGDRNDGTPGNTDDGTPENTTDGTPESPGDGEDTTPNETGDSTDGSDESVPEYADDLEECHLVSLQYRSFPEEIRAEIDTALEDGEYESDLLLFDRAVDVRTSYVVKDDVPYEPTVESTGETKVLTLTEVDAVRAPRPYCVSVENHLDQERTVSLLLEDEGGEKRLDETITVGPDEERDIESSAQEFGTYTLTVELTGDGTTNSETVRIGDEYFSPFNVWISEGELGVTQAVADMEPCPHTEFIED